MSPEWEIENLKIKWAGSSAEEILADAWNSCRGGIVATSSFQGQSLPLLHMISRVCPGLPVVFLDTRFHFQETLDFRDSLVKKWGLNVMVVEPVDEAEIMSNFGGDLPRSNPGLCCHLRKVEPMIALLRKFRLWISGVRADQTETRANFNKVERGTYDEIRIHPMIEWKAEDIEAYRAKHGLPEHPLAASGYRSIGCWPCTVPVGAGEDSRKGRWPGSGKTECGLHLRHKKLDERTDGE